MTDRLDIDEALVRRLVSSQFPQWRHLPVYSVTHGGWSNRTFHLGEEMVVRLPVAIDYAAQVEKEFRWLPQLAPSLPLSIPSPLRMGAATDDFPLPWAIYRWLDGETAAPERIANINDFAKDLANFLLALHRAESVDGPPPGAHSFFRGGALCTYDAETRAAIFILRDRLDVAVATDIWDRGLPSQWRHSPVWVHGDVSLGNLLVQHGRLGAVIDFGNAAVGDPACDLAIAWTLFSGKSREIFRATLSLDEDTWARGRAWTLWKAMIIAAGLSTSNAIEAKEPWRIIDAVLADHR